MAGIAAALAIPSDPEACRRFCAEVLGAARQWGPAEQRALFDQLPLVLQRLYVWLYLPSSGNEEALLQAFHPNGPLAVHLNTYGSPAYVFPLWRLPPRVVRAICFLKSEAQQLGAGLHPGTSQRVNVGGIKFARELCSQWFALLGPERLNSLPGGDVEGLVLTPQEFTLTCLVHYIGSTDQQLAGLMPTRQPSSLGGWTQPGLVVGGAGRSLIGGSGSTGFGGSSGSLNIGGTSWQRGMTQGKQGGISVAYERLLLAHLQAHLKHQKYELAYAHEPRASRFFLNLLHEFLLSPHPPEKAALASGTSSWRGIILTDVRAQPAVLHAIRVVVLHVLANPALRKSCEESALGLRLSGIPNAIARMASSSRATRLTREIALLGPAAVELIQDLLHDLKNHKQEGLDYFTSLLKLWLIMLQPWKASRLYSWYTSVRDPSPKMDPNGSSSGAAARTTRSSNMQTDLAIVRMEPEAPFGSAEYPPPRVPRGVGVSLGPAAGVVERVERRLEGQLPSEPISLVPGDGDGQSWRSYVVQFYAAYGLFESFLEVPVLVALCKQLCGVSRSSNSTDPAASTQGLAACTSGAKGGPHIGKYELLGQRHVIAALKSLAQALLCFTDPLLCRVLATVSSSQDQGSTPTRSLFNPGGELRPEVVSAVSAAWAALLECSANSELQPLLVAISRQLEQTREWAGKLPTVEDARAHASFKESFAHALDDVKDDLRQVVRSYSNLVMGSSLTDARFVGSEWERPARGGEVEVLLQVCYWLAVSIDWALGRHPKAVACGMVPQTEWPRAFANWKLLIVMVVVLILVVFY